MSLFSWEATPSVSNSTPCSEVFSLNDTSQRCAFVSSEPDCADIASKVDYLRWYFCNEGNTGLPLAAYAGVIAAYFVALAVAADGFLCPNLAAMAKTLRFSDNLAGVTFLAFGNGAPDVFSSVAGVSQSRPHLVMGALFGAGVFVTTVVAGSVAVAKPFKVMRRPFLRDAAFFLAAGAWASYLCWRRQIRWCDPLGFLLLYVAYMVVVLFGRMLNRRLRLRSRRVSQLLGPEEDEDEDERDGGGGEGFLNIFVPQDRISGHEVIVEEDDEVDAGPDQMTESGNNVFQGLDSIELEGDSDAAEVPESRLKLLLTALNPFGVEFCDQGLAGRAWALLVSPLLILFRLTDPVVDLEGEELLQGWCQPLHLVQCYVSPLFVVWVVGAWETDVYHGYAAWIPALIGGQVLALALALTSSPACKPRWHRLLAFAGFATAALWIYAVANEIVSLLRTLGVIFSLPDAVLGLSVLAWGNSVGDLCSDVTLARKGFPRMGFSGCFGGPLFNLLLGIGLPYSLLFLRRGAPWEPISVSTEDPVVLLLAGALGVSLVTSAVLLAVSGFHARRWYGVGMVALYAAFMAAAVTVQVATTQK